MAPDVLDNLDKKFELNKMNARVNVNQSFIINLTKLLIDKGLISKREINDLISSVEDQMKERMRLTEELSPNRSAGSQIENDRKKRKIRKECDLLRTVFK